jgi:hypothetical protein
MTAGKQDLVVLALARDCAATVGDFSHGLESLAGDGLGVHAFVGENGSRDDTRSRLECINGVTVVDTTAMSSGSTRLQRMALGRQLVADAARESSASAVLVIDIDEPFLAALDAADVRRALKRLNSESVFAVATQTAPTFYDLLAYEDDEVSFVGLDAEIEKRKRNPVAYYRLFRDFIYPWQSELTRDTDLSCLSSFNGAVFYRSEDFFQGSYISPDGAQRCEHITLHQSLRKITGQSMIVDGHIVLPAPPEHGHRPLLPFMWQRARKLADSKWRRR